MHAKRDAKIQLVPIPYSVLQKNGVQMSRSIIPLCGIYGRISFKRRKTNLISFLAVKASAHLQWNLLNS